jgi:DNA-binding transcriptional MerR regulator
MKLPFFGESKKAEDSAGRGYVPTDRVHELTGRGFSELDTIDVLRREGFSPDEIDKALTQTLKEGVTGGGQADAQQTQMPWQEQQPPAQSAQQMQAPQQYPYPPARQPEQRPQEQPELRLPTMDDLQGKATATPVAPESSLPDEYYQGYPTEEYIDYVVQERTRDVTDKLNEFSLRNREIEAKIRDMSERVGEMSKMRINEQQQVLSTIEGLTDSVNDVNMRIAGLEKAFKDTLPALIESVRALCDLVGRVRREA